MPARLVLAVLAVAVAAAATASAAFTGEARSDGNAARAAAAAAPPAATAPPRVTGAATVGATLSADDGTWAGGRTTGRAWLRCAADGTGCAALLAATGTVWTVTEEDVGATLRLRVTRTNTAGSTTAVSAPTPVVAGGRPAGVLTVHGCRHPATGAPVASTGGFAPELSGPVGPVEALDRCATDGHLTALLRASGGRLRDGMFAAWRFDAPAGTRVTALRLHRSARLAATPHYTGWRPYFQVHALTTTWLRLENMPWLGGPGPELLGTEAAPLDPANVLARSGLDAGVVHVRVACAHNVAGAPCEGEHPDYARVRLHRTEITLRDAAPPEGSVRGGTLASAAVLGADAEVDVAVTDAGTGAHRAKLLVDGVRVGGWQPLAPASATCRDAVAGDGPPGFLAPVPCPLATTATLRFGLAAVPPGEHAVALVVADAAGNETTVLRRTARFVQG
jgi:hypothetical protein